MWVVMTSHDAFWPKSFNFEKLHFLPECCRVLLDFLQSQNCEIVEGLVHIEY